MAEDKPYLLENVLQFRVPYHETDGQARVHHSNYFKYFEQGRVELLRDLGHGYGRMEQEGLLLVVAEIHCRYLVPAAFDEMLTLFTRVVRVTAVRIFHEYELKRGDDILATASSTVACVDRTGKVRPMPGWFRNCLNVPSEGQPG